ncbi:MAG: hypothetical protein QXX20_03450 [Candidatus Thermoplasmatota archaeon]
MFQRAELCEKLLQTMIDIISRRTSQDYALVIIYSATKNLEIKYPFFKAVTIQNVRFSEYDRFVSVAPTLNTTNGAELSAGLQELITSIVTSMGSHAGFFFMKELQDKLGPMYSQEIRDLALDLNFLQSQLTLEQQQHNTSTSNHQDFIKKMFKAVIEILEKDMTTTEALEFLRKQCAQHSEEHQWLRYISLVNVRIVQGVDMVVVAPDVDSVDCFEIGKTFNDLLNDLRTQLEHKGGSYFFEEFKKKFTSEYLQYMQDIGIQFKKYQASYEDVLKEIINATLIVLSKASTHQYAVFAVNNFLRKIESRFTYFKYITVVPSQEPGKNYDIIIMENLDQISETDTRRGIQKLLNEICTCLGASLRKQFIDEFKKSLDPVFLERIEEMGINLHMIQLRQEFL